MIIDKLSINQCKPIVREITALAVDKGYVDEEITDQQETYYKHVDKIGIITPTNLHLSRIVQFQVLSD